MQPRAASHVQEDAGAAKTDSSSPELGCFAQRRAKRKPNTLMLYCATRNVAPSINNCSFGCIYNSRPTSEDDLNPLYQFLGVYRC